MAELVDIIEVAECCNQADDGAQNAQRRRVRTSLRQHRAAERMAFLHDRELRVEDVADEVRVHAVDDHAEARAEERVVDIRDLVLEGQDAFAAGNLRQLDEEPEQFALVMAVRLVERHLDDFRQRLELRHAEAREQAGNRADDDDEECGRVIECGKRRALQDHADENGDESQDHADDG